MCDFSKGFKRCTCKEKTSPIIHHKKLKRRKRHAPILPDFTWTLSQYIGKSTAMLEGFAGMPSGELTPQLTVNFVLAELNKSNCFDFDYTPSEGDHLIIKHINSGFLSFIFKNQT